MVGAPRTEIYGPFEVLERLGIGGMATVHRAIERGTEGFERVVALKRLLPHLAEDEEFVRAFVREAKLASLLRHGSVVQIYELGRVGSSYFISMEYIPGRDLRVILRHARRVCGPPPIEVALALLNELLEALDYAHTQRGADGRPLGIVHRDISPSNLLVSHTGHLKVIDFGIAKATVAHLMTHTGRVKGKLSYMAPEALAGRLDARSDLFSASVIAYELLTATPLFACKEDLQTIDRLQNMHPLPPSSKNPSSPPELDAIVLRGLAKDPAKRWQSAAEMRVAVMELAAGRYRLATKREVCHWVEEAFEMPTPARRRMPLAAPGSSDGRRNGTSDADDELMDMVWGGTGPSAQQHPVVLDEVPDVSGRISAVVPMPTGRSPFEPLDPMRQSARESRELAAEPLVEEEPTNDMLRPVDLGPLAGVGAAPVHPNSARAASVSGVPGVAGIAGVDRRTLRSHAPPPPASDIFSLGGTPAAVSWPQGAEPPHVRPPEWAFGTSPTTGPQPSSGVLDESLADARRAMGAMAGTASPAAPRRRAPLLPVLAASIAVAGAGAAVAWLLSARGENASTQTVAAAQPKGVSPAEPPPPAVRALPPEEAPAAGVQADRQAVAAPAEAPAAAGDQSAGKVEPPADPAAPDGDERAGKQPANQVITRDPERPVRPVRDDDGGDDRDHEPRKKGAKRGKRDGKDEPRGRADGDDAPEDEDEGGEESAGGDGGDRVTTAPPRSSPSAPRGNDSKARKSTDREAPEETEPEVVEPEPKPTPAEVPAAPSRPKKPVIITPNRAVRESGKVPRLRFPPWEQAPPAITYRLCLDESGAVTSVSVLSKLSGSVRTAVVDALKRWRYKPVVQAGQKVPACFATTFKTELQ